MTRTMHAPVDILSTDGIKQAFRESVARLQPVRHIVTRNLYLDFAYPTDPKLMKDSKGPT